MAFILLKNRQTKFVSAKQGATIWRVINGEVTGTKEQQAFCKNILRLYLNPYTAPQSYLDKHPDMMQPRSRELAMQTRLPYVD